MARGFGTTAGVDGNDVITTSFTKASPGKRSYSARIKATSSCLSSSTFPRIFHKGAIIQDEIGYFTGSNADPPTANAIIYTSPRDLTGGNWNTPVGTLVDTNWHHVLWVYDNTSTLNDPVIYFDGVAQVITANTPPVGTPLTDSDPFLFGNRPALDRCWDGYLADMAIWDNVLLTAGEAKALSQGVRPGDIRSQLLAGWWPLAGTQSPEPDVSGYHNDAVVSGTLGAADPPYKPLHKYPKKVRVIANVGSRIVKTVNVVTPAGGFLSEQIATCSQEGPPAQNEYEVVQDSGGNFPGLKSISMVGYTGPR